MGHSTPRGPRLTAPRRRPARGLLTALWLFGVLTSSVFGLGTVEGLVPGQSAQEAGRQAPVISMADAVRRALEHNHQLRAASHEHRAATWARRRAAAQLLPSIRLESSYTRLDDETVSRANAFGREITMYLPDSTGALQPVTIEIPQTVFRDGYETAITGQLLLLNPSVWNGAALAGASRDLAEDELHDAMQSTVHRTLRAYLELLKLHSLVRVQGQHVAQATRSTAQAERLFDVGRYSEADVLRWRVEEAQQQGMLEETRRALRMATLALENLIGAQEEKLLRPELHGDLRGNILRTHVEDLTRGRVAQR